MVDWPTFLSPEARIDLWTILVGLVANTACALLGCFLVLRRMSLLGDAVSHAVLAGVAGAFLLTGSIAIGPLLIGAVAVGVLTALLTQTLSTFGRVPEDSAMGVVFTSLFALGVVLISGVEDLHLDTDCVLFGKLGFAAVYTVDVWGLRVPHAMTTLVPACALTVLFATAFWKELKIASFDPLLATSMGLSALVIHYLLMSMVAVVTVAALEAVGAIIVVAMLIVPAATAHLLTDRLNRMLLLSVAVGAISAIAGAFWARRADTNAAGMMAVVAGLQFAAAVILGPRYGLLGKWLGMLRLSVRIACEDVVAALYRREEFARQTAAAEPAPLTRAECRRAAGDGFAALLAVPRLRRRGYVEATAESRLVLTDHGRRMGQSLVRSHRLWETFLNQNFDLPPDHLHEPAERIEHYIGPELQEQLAHELARPSVDPHGKTIPPPQPETSESP
ncbi:MAG: metal ABC transporter permease [Planctomycetes bacterium]|nr:metal ABC transporter permease [Planctomycetota bacterium]